MTRDAITGDEMTIEMGKQLRVLARAIYKRHGVSVTIIERLGDTPSIPITPAYEVIADSKGKYDLWNHETLVKPDLDLDGVLHMLDELAEPAKPEGER